MADLPGTIQSSDAAIKENEVNLAQTRRFFKRETGKKAKNGQENRFFRQKKGCGVTFRAFLKNTPKNRRFPVDSCIFRDYII